MIRTCTVFIFLLLLSSAGYTQSGEADSSRSMKSGIYPLPILFYTPETGVAGGAAAMYLYRDPAFPRASTITGDVIYTEKKQIIIELSGDQYFNQGSYRLLSTLKFQKYPNKFFGIGNGTLESDEESYTSQAFLLSAVLYRNIFSQVNIAPLIRIEDVSLIETDPAGKIARGTIPGTNGGSLAGVGLVANWDSRDNTIAAQSGSLHQLTALFYSNTFGSDFDFRDIQIDTRNFFELAPGQILAIHASGEFINGTAPFQRLAGFGGQNLLRGYFDGRYRDNHCVALEAEYRIPVWWRIGVVGFAGAAQVADRISHMGSK